MSEIKICGLILCVLVVSAFFKQLRAEYSLILRIFATILVTYLSITAISPLLDYINEITKDTAVNKYLPVLLKSLGISLVIHLTADICNDAGETSLAEKITLFGKMEILVLSLPLIKELFNLAQGMLI